MNESNVESVLYAVGTRGYSAYEVAVQNGFSGTEQEWLESLVGPVGNQGIQGKSAYDIAVENGFIGTEEEWVDSFLTPDGYYSKQDIDNRIVNNLLSDDGTKILAAKQGKELKKLIDDNESSSNNKFHTVESNISDINNTLLEKANTNEIEQTYATKEQLQLISSGTPLVASNVSDMTDTTKIYVNTTDGNWYYYDGDSWEIGGVYQASVNSEDVTTLIKENNSYNQDIVYEFDSTMTEGKRLGVNDGAEYAQAGFEISPFWDVENKYDLTFEGLPDVIQAPSGTQSAYNILAFYDKNKTFISKRNIVATGASGLYLRNYPLNTKYIRLSINTGIPTGTIKVTGKQLLNNRLNNVYNNFNIMKTYDTPFDKYIDLSVGIGSAVSLTPQSSNHYTYIILNCKENDSFIINGRGGSQPRLWGFIDSNNNLLSVSTSGLTGLHRIIAPLNSAKLICNFKYDSKSDYDNITLIYTENTNLVNIKEGYDYTVNSIEGYNIKTDYNIGETVSLTPQSNGSYRYLIIDCLPNEEFIINGYGGITTRLWAFTDSSNKLLLNSNSSASGTFIIKAPSNASKLICNFQKAYNYSLKKYSDLSVANVNDKIEKYINTIENSSFEREFSNPINDGMSFIKGLKTANDLNNYLGDFKKDGDLMVHVSTFKIINNIVYMTYFANTTTGGEDPNYLIARLVTAPLNDLSNKTYYDIQKVGDTFDGNEITSVYDIILMSKSNTEIYLMYAVVINGVYTRLYKVFDITNNTLSDANYNYFEINNDREIMNITNINSLLNSNNIDCGRASTDIGIMQKVTTRIENNITYYYTGIYAGRFHSIIKSTDFITWEFVSTPDFYADTRIPENACYIKGDYCYYFIRLQYSYNYGLLTRYNFTTHKWDKPIKIKDCQSRSCFFEYNNQLYLVHANQNRNHITTTYIDTTYPALSVDVNDAYVNNSFYPYVDTYNNQMYMSYTQDRKHIYLAYYNLPNNDNEIRNTLYNLFY